jgi:SAM-dependent methyltransferase
MSIRDSEIMALAALDYLPVDPASSSALRLLNRVSRFRQVKRLLTLSYIDVLIPIDLIETPDFVIHLSLRSRSQARSTSSRLTTVAAASGQLPFKSGTFDVVVELGGSLGLSAATDDEAEAAMIEIARVLRPGGRYLSEGSRWPPRRGASVSADRRRIDDWRQEADGIWHHTLRLARADGSWRRLHERLRPRGFGELQHVLTRAGFDVLESPTDSGYLSETANSATGAILLCERK